MKNLLLLYSTLWTLYLHGQTSVYNPFPDTAAIWNISSSQGCGGFGFDTWGHSYSITISGDTIISSTNYHKLNVPIEVIFSNGGCDTSGTWTIPGHFVGSIRQDTSNKKVFFIPPTDTIEQLLYDFNMAIGDTVKGYIERYISPANRDRVQSIDSVLVGNSYRKRWKINSWYNIYFIEGIGSTYGLVNPSPGNGTDGPIFDISCFHQNGQTLYPNTTTNCEIITFVNSIDKFLNEIKIYPNPSKGSFTADFNQSVKKIWLTDLLGNIIFNHETNNQTKLKIDNLSSGTYILTAVDKDGRTTNKKIISCP